VKGGEAGRPGGWKALKLEGEEDVKPGSGKRAESWYARRPGSWKAGLRERFNAGRMATDLGLPASSLPSLPALGLPSLRASKLSSMPLERMIYMPGIFDRLIKFRRLNM